MDDTLFDAGSTETTQSSESEQSQETEAQSQTQSEGESESQTQSNQWPESSGEAKFMLDQEIPGSGEPPEWFKSNKFQTVAEQAKAYDELERKFGAHKGAPAQYDLTLENHPDVEFNSDDPVISDFLKQAKEHNVSQDFVSKTLSRFADYLKVQQPDVQEEKRRLGPDADQQLQALWNWAEQHLDQNEMKTMDQTIKTADAVRMLQKLKHAATSPAVTEQEQPPAHENVERKLSEMIADERFDSDPQYRKEVWEYANKYWN